MKNQDKQSLITPAFDKDNKFKHDFITPPARIRISDMQDMDKRGSKEDVENILLSTVNEEISKFEASGKKYDVIDIVHAVDNVFKKSKDVSQIAEQHQEHLNYNKSQLKNRIQAIIEN